MENSYEVLEQFNKIENITIKCFVNFDIANFYPSIKQQHLTKAIIFAKNYTDTKDESIRLIKHLCKTILIYDNRT